MKKSCVNVNSEVEKEKEAHNKKTIQNMENTIGNITKELSRAQEKATDPENMIESLLDKIEDNLQSTEEIPPQTSHMETEKKPSHSKVLILGDSNTKHLDQTHESE